MDLNYSSENLKCKIFEDIDCFYAK